FLEAALEQRSQRLERAYKEQLSHEFPLPDMTQREARNRADRAGRGPRLITPRMCRSSGWTAASRMGPLRPCLAGCERFHPPEIWSPLASHGWTFEEIAGIWACDRPQTISDAVAKYRKGV